MSQNTLIPTANKQALAIRRRAKGLNIDQLSDSDAVDAFVGVVNSLMFKDARDVLAGNGERIQIRWSSPENPGATADPKKNTIELPWPGPCVDAEKYLALRGYALQEFGRLQTSHPQMLERVKANGGDDAAQIAAVIDARRVDRLLTNAFNSTYDDARAQIVQDCQPTPEQQAEFDAADPVAKLVNDFTILSRELPYHTSSPSHIVDRLRKWMTLADQHARAKGAAQNTWGLSEDPQTIHRRDQRVQTNNAQQTANLSQIFLTAFKDVYDSRPPKDPNQQDQQPDPDGQGQGQGQGGGGGQGQQPPSMQQQMQQGLQSSADTAQYHQCVQEPTDAQQEVASEDGHSTCASDHLTRVQRNANIPDLVEILRRRGARVASTLRRALAAKSRFGDETDMDDGDLDPEKLPEIARGKWDNPFMRPGRIIHDRDTAVHICIDGSGSMDGPPGDGGRLSAFVSRCGDSHKNPKACFEAICAQMQPDAADTLRDLANALHPSVWSDPNNSYTRNLMGTLFASKIWISGATLAVHDALRSSRIAHEISVFDGPYIVLKSWKQRGLPPGVQNTFRNGGFSGGGTPAGTSWKNSLGSLLKRRETRRILIVMSDGEIPTNEAKIGRAVIQTARELGIEVYGLGIMSNGVAKVFPPKARNSVATVAFGDDLNRRMQDLVHGILTHAGDHR